MIYVISTLIDINLAVPVGNMIFMRRSNCSAPIPPPGGSPGIRGKTCVIKKGGALENKMKRGRGTLK